MTAAAVGHIAYCAMPSPNDQTSLATSTKLTIASDRETPAFVRRCGGIERDLNDMTTQSVCRMPSYSGAYAIGTQSPPVII